MKQTVMEMELGIERAQCRFDGGKMIIESGYWDGDSDGDGDGDKDIGPVLGDGDRAGT